MAGYKPYWDSEAPKKEEDKTKEEKDKEAKKPHASQKYLYNHKDSSSASSFGETLLENKRPVIVIYDFTKKKIHIHDIARFKTDGQLDSDGRFVC